MNTICIMCPMGCPLTIEEKDGVVSVSGNTCPRGRKYGEQEFKSPERTLTTLVKMEGGGVASVKTTCPIPKDRLFELTDYIGTLSMPATCKIGDVVEVNPLGIQTEIVVTGRP